MDSYVMVFTKNNNSMHRSCHFHKALSLIGSVLVACAHFGAHVMGSDIDYTLLHGRGTRSVIFCLKIPFDYQHKSSRAPSTLLQRYLKTLPFKVFFKTASIEIVGIVS